MPAEKPLNPSSSPAALWGSELRHYRQAAGLSQPELAQRVFCSRQLIGAMETGDQLPDPDRVKLLDKELDTRGALDRLYEKLKLGVFPEWFLEWPGIEAKAVLIRGYTAMVVPGLLQTEEYARALLGDEAKVRARIERQAILTRAEPPPAKLRYIFDEGVLHREVGDRDVMRAQLEHLAAISVPHVTVQVVPMGVHAGLSGDFNIASLDGGESIGYVDTAARGLVMERPADIAALVDVFELLREDALPRRQSRELITRAAEQWT
jgi:transcriptional regulator with XRE-family HTH domain